MKEKLKQLSKMDVNKDNVLEAIELAVGIGNSEPVEFVYVKGDEKSERYLKEFLDSLSCRDRLFAVKSLRDKEIFYFDYVRGTFLKLTKKKFKSLIDEILEW